MLASPALWKVDGLGTRANDQIAVEGVEGCVVVNTVTPHHSELRAESARFGHGGKGATRRHGLHLGFTTMALKDLIDALGAPREALGRRGGSRMNRAKHADQVGGMPRRNLCSMARNTFPCRRPIEKDRHVSPTTHFVCVPLLQKVWCLRSGERIRASAFPGPPGVEVRKGITQP